MELYQLDVGIWATIFSYLEKEKLFIYQIYEFNDILENPGFWTELIRQKFPEWYVSSEVGYNWRGLCFQMIEFDEFKRNISCSDDIDWKLNKYRELRRYFIVNNLLVLDERRVRNLITDPNSNLELDLIKSLFDSYTPDHKLLKNILKYYLRINTNLELDPEIKVQDLRNQHNIFKYILNYKCDLIEITKDDLSKLLYESYFSSEDLEAIYYKINKPHPMLNDTWFDLLHNRLKFMLRSNFFRDNIQYMLRDYPEYFTERDISAKNLILVLENSFRTNKYPFILEVYKRSKHLLSQEDIKELTQLFLNINRLHLTHDLVYLNHELDDNSLLKMSLDELLELRIKMISTL